MKNFRLFGLHLGIILLTSLGIQGKLFSQQIPSYVPNEGLLGWWPFSGNASDESGQGNHGLVNGAALNTDRNENPNSAFSFDGINDYITIADNPGLRPSSFTVSAWIMGNTFAGNRQVFAKCAGNGPFESIDLLVNNSNGYNFMCNIGGPDYYGTWMSSPSQLPINSWKHLVYTFDNISGIQRMYIDAVLVNSGAANAIVTYDDRPLSIGSELENGQWAWFFSGKIDDIGFWSRPLLEEEIINLFLAPIPGCTDINACNYSVEANAEDGSCLYAQNYYNCLDECLNDLDGDGTCDELEVPGCTYSFACNYNPDATQDDGSCVVSDLPYGCDGQCIADFNENGICDSDEIYGCIYSDALNFNPMATDDDASCLFSCSGDLNSDGNIDTSDLLELLTAFGGTCEF